MNITRISVDPYNYQVVLDFSLLRTVNDHTKGHVVGYIDEGSEEKYLDAAEQNKSIAVTAHGDEGTKTLFIGAIDRIRIYEQNSFKIMEITFISFSSFLDCYEQKVTYQEKNTRISDILDFVNDQVFQLHYFIVSEQYVQLGEYAVQYEESSWAFLKQIASHFNTVIHTNDMKDSLRLYFGSQFTASESRLDPIFYEVRKDLKEYHRKKEHGLTSYSEVDATYYIITEYDLRTIGEQVMFLEKELYLHDSSLKYVKGEFIFDVL